MAELADALASGASDREVVWVQVPSPAPYRTKENHLDGSPLFVFYPRKAVFGVVVPRI